ncbi:MAG: class I SAM-dependent methyltransferase [Verrucomicrobia bacterium]|nr:class I SAM-dependent methyltransferase [Verrucomicrobiota bacterium]
MVEIGSWKGKSTICLARGLGDRASIFAIDPHVGSEEHHKGGAEKVWTFDQFKQNLERFGVVDFVTPVVDYSDKVGQRWSQPIELLFIDGAHDEPSVQKDFELFWPHLVVGGWVVMHDTTGTWIPGLCGWKGPRKVAARHLFGSEEIGPMRVVDTITAGQRVAPGACFPRGAKRRLRLRKLFTDGLSVAINMANRLPSPMVWTIRKLLRRA